MWISTVKISTYALTWLENSSIIHDLHVFGPLYGVYGRKIAPVLYICPSTGTENNTISSYLTDNTRFTLLQQGKIRKYKNVLFIYVSKANVLHKRKLTCEIQQTRVLVRSRVDAWIYCSQYARCIDLSFELYLRLRSTQYKSAAGPQHSPLTRWLWPSFTVGWLPYWYAA